MPHIWCMIYCHFQMDNPNTSPREEEEGEDVHAESSRRQETDFQQQGRQEAQNHDTGQRHFPPLLSQRGMF